MHQALSLTCGALNTAFVAFHLLLGVALARQPGLGPDVRALLLAFDVGGTLLIAFLAYAFLCCRADLGTRLGRGAVVLGALVYLTRAGAELAFFPTPKAAILVTCTILGALHLFLLRQPGPGNTTRPPSTPS